MNPATDHGKTPLPPHIRNRSANGLVSIVWHGLPTEHLNNLLLPVSTLMWCELTGTYLIAACIWKEESASFDLVQALSSISLRFTEFLVEEMKSSADLHQLILSYFPAVDVPNALTDGTIR